MIGHIVRKEIVSNLLSYKFFVVVLLAAVLVATSFFVMARDFKARRADYQLIRPEPGAPIAVLPPHPLSIFAKGLEESLTRSFEVATTGIDVRAGQASGNVVFSFFPAPDLAYIIKVVLSLVAILFGFDAVSREKEAGTLKLALSNAVSRSSLLLGKWIGNFAGLAVPFLLVVGLGLTVMSFDPDLRLSAAELGRFAVVLAAGLAYIALFLSLGLFVSSLVRRSATSLVVLLLAWSVLVFVLPNLGTLLARQLVDVPSVKALSEKREQIWTREVLRTYTEEGGWDRRVAAMNEEFDRMEEDYRRKFDRLVRLSRSLNRVSPAASFMDAATEIAGTGVGEEMRLKAEVIRYKNLALPSLARDRTAKKAPAFSYRARTLAEVLADGALFDLAWLAVLNVLLFAAGYVAFIRTDPR